jgi:hypothetical protein
VLTAANADDEEEEEGGIDEREDQDEGAFSFLFSDF